MRTDRWFHEDDESLAEINITPLVDVALVLLIIFMITAPMLMQGANVELPRTQPISKLPSGQLFIRVTEDGEIFLNDEDSPIPMDDLEERLVPFAEMERAAYIMGDVKAYYGQIAGVLAAVAGAGIEDVNMVTQPDPERRR